MYGSGPVGPSSMNMSVADVVGHSAQMPERLLDKEVALIAIENKQLAATIRHYLQAFGVQTVDMARSCVDARAYMESTAYSLVYVDFALPAMGGPDFVRFLRTSTSGSADALVTMMVSSPRKGDIFRARDAGCNEIISVPIATKHLMARLQHMLRNPREMVKAPEYVGPCRRRRHLDVDETSDRRKG